MTIGPDRIVEDLHKLIADLESLVARAKDTTGERVGDHLQDAAEGIRGLIGAAQERLADFKAELRRRVGETAKAAESSVRESPWTTVAIAAAAAFVLGLALAGGPSGGERRRTGDGGRGPDEPDGVLRD
jgi:ElaB/YqjD/DUF883 family membrane-anchored ribosome-binding protein